MTELGALVALAAFLTGGWAQHNLKQIQIGRLQRELRRAHAHNNDLWTAVDKKNGQIAQLEKAVELRRERL